MDKHTRALLDNARLVPQSYGLAMAQTRFGGPTGIWLECRECPTNDVIAGSGQREWWEVRDASVAAIFRRNGWTGTGSKMLQARCPKCSAAKVAA